MKLMELNNITETNEVKTKRGRRSPAGGRSQLSQTQKSDSPTKKKNSMRGRGEKQRHHAKKNIASQSNNYSPNRRTNSKSNGGPTSKVPHDMPMGKKDIYFGLDCEMVGVGPHGVDSALARVSIVNYDCEIVLDTFVKVSEPVTDYRTFVSGVRAEHIESVAAMPLDYVRGAVLNILRGKILIGHGLENDLKALMISHPWCDTRDTATYAPYMREVEDKHAKADISETQKIMLPRRLKDLAMEKLGKKIQAAGYSHSPIEDSLAAVELYKAARPDWEKSICAEVKKANEILPSLCLPTLGRRIQVQPLPVSAPPAQHSPKFSSSRQRQQRKKTQQNASLPYAGHTSGDDRSSYFVPPAHNNVLKNGSHAHQQQAHYPSLSSKHAWRYQQGPAPAFLRSSVQMIHT